MTSNQINYANLLRQRSYDRKALAETKRANLAREDIDREKNLITRENYRAMRDIEREKNDLTRLNNRAMINYNMSRLEEDRRHNVAQESKDLLYMNRSLSEQERHNIAMEGIQSTANYVTQQRDLMNYNLGVSNLNESMRHNFANEQNQSTLADIQKFNTESQVALANREQTQSQLLDYSKYLESVRSNKAKEQEVERHNRVTEDIQSRKQTLDTISTISHESNSWFRSLSPSFASR